MNSTKVLFSKLQNPIWAVKKAYHWTRGIIKLNGSEVILVCFPKTGSTYTNVLLYNILRKSKPTDNFHFKELDETMAAFGTYRFLKPWPFTDSPRICTTRQFYLPIFKKNRIIFLGRDPRDVMASCLPFAKSYKALSFKGGMEELVRHEVFGLENYLKLYSTWKEHIDYVLKYEEMRKNPLETIKNLLDFLGVERTDQEIQDALEASSLEKTRKAQEASQEYLKNQFNDNFKLARKGAVGEGSTQFTPSLNNFYKELREKYNYNLYPF